MARRLTKPSRFARTAVRLRNARYVAWRLFDEKKIPIDRTGQRLTDLNTKKSKLTFGQARALVKKGVATGIGVQIFRSDYCVLDLDDCVEDGVIARWALELLRRCNSYADFSPSGEGIHIYLVGTPSCGNHTQIAMGQGHLDIFANKGYVTVTGRPVPGYGGKAVIEGAKTVESIYGEADPLSKAIKAIKRHGRARKLYRGDTSNYESPSEADLAFVRFAAPFVNNDRSLILRLIRQSNLYRKKWDRKDYQNKTLNKVLGNEPTHDIAEDLERLARKVADFLEQDIPPPEWLITGLLEIGTIIMVYGPGGVGKSHLLYSIVWSLDQGRPFMYWNVSKRRTVLLIDTEMPERLIQKRLDGWFESSPPDKAYILSSALFRTVLDTHFKLDKEEHQRILRALILEKDINVVIIDPLAPALDCDENSNNDVGKYMPFLTELRDLGVTVILSHHSGKSEDAGQRGASRRRDYLDMSIQLAEAKVGRNARFIARFDKVREETPEPAVWTSELMWDDGFVWDTSSELPQDDDRLVAVLRYLHSLEGKLNVSEMAVRLGIRRAGCYDVFKRAAFHGFMNEKERTLTLKGIALIEQLTKDSDNT